MITVELYGRTGNNMFQIAAALALAKRHNTTAGFVGSNEHLEGFKLKGFSRSSSKCPNIYQENKFTYNPEFENITDNVHIDGYFQSEKYFINIEEDIRRCFSFNQNIVEQTKKWQGSKFKRILYGDVATALHIRRTDYLKYPDIYPQFGLEYYDKCLDKIADKGTVLVFSDDLKWCSATFGGRGYEFVDMPAIPSMYLMSHCKNIIMANSSFSWWAAWLGRAEKVFYPSNWFGKKWPHMNIHASHDECTKDLCPNRWLKA